MLAAFVLAAAIDWMWELTIVGLVAVVALGMLVGLATEPSTERGRAAAASASGTRGELHLRALRTAAVAVVARGDHVHGGADARRRSGWSRARRAANRGDVAEAVNAAEGARSLQPWASSPYLQLALIEEQANDLGQANRYIKECAQARQPGLEHLARSGAHPDQGWFDSSRAPQPAGGPRR